MYHVEHGPLMTETHYAVSPVNLKIIVRLRILISPQHLIILCKNTATLSHFYGIPHETLQLHQYKS